MTEKRKQPINKRHERAFRLTLWSPEGRVMVEGPITKLGAAEVFRAAMHDVNVRQAKAPPKEDT